MKLEPFRAGKGMNFETMYYHFVFMYHYCQYADCVKHYEMNIWWYSQLKPKASKQILELYEFCKNKIK